MASVLLVEFNGLFQQARRQAGGRNGRRRA
jgi:hypothetical protein